MVENPRKVKNNPALTREIVFFEAN